MNLMEPGPRSLISIAEERPTQREQSAIRMNSAWLLEGSASEFVAVSSRKIYAATSGQRRLVRPSEGRRQRALADPDRLPGRFYDGIWVMG